METLKLYADLCVEKDKLTSQIRDIDNRMRQLRSKYMLEVNTWGLTDVMMRKEVDKFNMYSKAAEIKISAGA
jgi:hypothetical protein